MLNRLNVPCEGIFFVPGLNGFFRSSTLLSNKAYLKTKILKQYYQNGI